jgi:hypothetical protein
VVRYFRVRCVVEGGILAREWLVVADSEEAAIAQVPKEIDPKHKPVFMAAEFKPTTPESGPES